MQYNSLQEIPYTKDVKILTTLQSSIDSSINIPVGVNDPDWQDLYSLLQYLAQKPSSMKYCLISNAVPETIGADIDVPLI